ncbi:hypothetical protein RUND412_007112, partial [Rhizina undulata]
MSMDIKWATDHSQISLAMKILQTHTWRLQIVELSIRNVPGGKELAHTPEDASDHATTKAINPTARSRDRAELSRNKSRVTRKRRRLGSVDMSPGPGGGGSDACSGIWF